ncbi:MAG: hypothetical protein RL033_6306 [Pseudomonadota bacterium]|jgi:hypothetical protein
MTLQRYRAAQYQSLEGTLFTLSTLDVQQPAASFTLRLDAVQDLGERPVEGGSLPCCALLFSQCDGPGKAYAPQGIYRLLHPDLGEQELFVVPMGPARGAPMCYEVIFN